jgi:polyphenol oxidase
VTSAVTSRQKSSESILRGLDERLQAGGLVRNPRKPLTNTEHPPRFDQVAPQELTREAPQPVIAANGVQILQVPAWRKDSWIWHGFSTRKGGASRAYCAEDAGGEMNLGFTAEDPREVVLQNRRLLVEAVTGNPNTPLVSVRQFHSNLSLAPELADVARERPRRADGVLTAEPGLLLAIQTADCIPVLVADRKHRAVAAFHAGWRGTVKRIVEMGVGKMRLQFGSRPADDLVAAIGPGMGPCCYAVGEDVLSEFESQFTYARELFCEVYSSDAVRTRYPMLFLTQRAPGHSPIGPQLHLDLIEANRRQLLSAGLDAKNITVVGGCTGCRPDLFYSHRAMHGCAGRMMSVIGIRPRGKR